MKVIRISALWCPSCLMMKTIYQEIEKEYPMYEYIDYDYDFDSEKIEKYQVGNILPVLLLCDDSGQELKRIVGEHSKNELRQFMG